MSNSTRSLRTRINPVRYCSDDVDDGFGNGDDVESEFYEDFEPNEAQLESEDEDEDRCLDYLPTLKKNRDSAPKVPGNRTQDLPTLPQEPLLISGPVESDFALDQRLNNSELGFTSYPDTTDMNQYNEFAQTVIDSLSRYSESNLPPLLSLIYIPWKPKYSKLMVENDKPVLADFKGTHGKYNERTMLDIPWLPRSIPYKEEKWRLAVYVSLGAEWKEIAKRVRSDDESVPETTRLTARTANRDTNKPQTIDTIARKMRKVLDDWRKVQGGFIHLDRQYHDLSKDGTVPQVTRAILSGSSKRRRLTPLQLFCNCLWEVDSFTRTMRLPRNQDGTRHPLFRPRMTDDFQSLLVSVGSKLGLPVPALRSISLAHPELFGSTTLARMKNWLVDDSANSVRHAEPEAFPGVGTGESYSCYHSGAHLAGGAFATDYIQGDHQQCNQRYHGCCHAPNLIGQFQNHKKLQGGDGYPLQNNSANIHAAKRRSFKKAPTSQIQLNTFLVSDGRFWELQWAEEDERGWRSIPQQLVGNGTTGLHFYTNDSLRKWRTEPYDTENHAVLDAIDFEDAIDPSFLDPINLDPMFHGDIGL